MSAQPLPKLLDCRGVMDETGVKRATAEAIIRQVPQVEIPGLRKILVRRDDVIRYLNECTRSNDQAPRVA